MLPEIQLVRVDQLTPLVDNPRTISKHRLQRLCDSIDRDPDFIKARPLLVNNASGQLVVYAGNQRLKSVEMLGWDVVPCIIETLSIEEQNSRMLKDNVHAGEWDASMLMDDFDIDFLRYEIGIKLELPSDLEGFEDSEPRLSISNNFTNSKSIQHFKFKNYKIPLTTEEADWLEKEITDFVKSEGDLIEFYTKVFEPCLFLATI